MSDVGTDRKAVNDVDPSGRFMQLVRDIREKAVTRGKDTIIHILHKLTIQFGKIFEEFI